MDALPRTPGCALEARVNLWDEVLAKVEAKVNRHSFATWFRPTTFVSLQDGRLRIGVPNAQFKDWLAEELPGRDRGGPPRARAG